MAASDWKKAMVVLSDEDCQPAQDGSAAVAPESNPATQRAKLFTEISNAGLTNEVQLPEAGPSPLLLVEATERALEIIDGADCVKEVTTISDRARLEQI